MNGLHDDDPNRPTPTGAGARVLVVLSTRTYKAALFLEAARRTGVELIVASDREPALARWNPEAHLVVPLSRLDEAVQRIEDVHRRRRIDGILAGDDEGVPLAAAAAHRLGLAFHDPEGARATVDKAELRRRLQDTGEPTPWFRLVDPADERLECMAARLDYPVVVKPRSLSASRGVLRADDPASFLAAVERVARLAAGVGGAGPRLLVERYLPGREVAVEALVRDGCPEVLAVFDKPDPMEGPTFEETLYVTPSRHGPEVLEAIRRSLRVLARDLGLRHGPLHAEYRLHDGAVWLLDLAGRSIGGLCSRTLRFRQGSLEAVLLLQAAGRLDTAPERLDEAAGVAMLPVPREGVFQGASGVAEARSVPGVEDIRIAVAPGTRVRPLPEGDRYMGFVFARGEGPEEVETALRRALEGLELRIAPSEGGLREGGRGLR